MMLNVSSPLSKVIAIQAHLSYSDTDFNSPCGNIIFWTQRFKGSHLFPITGSQVPSGTGSVACDSQICSLGPILSPSLEATGSGPSIVSALLGVKGKKWFPCPGFWASTHTHLTLEHWAVSRAPQAVCFCACQQPCLWLTYIHCPHVCSDWGEVQSQKGGEKRGAECLTIIILMVVIFPDCLLVSGTIELSALFTWAVSSNPQNSTSQWVLLFPLSAL